LPITNISLDFSERDEDVIILNAKNLLLKLIEDKRAKNLLVSPEVQNFLATDDLTFRDFRESMNKMLNLEQTLDEELAQVGQKILRTRNIRNAMFEEFNKNVKSLTVEIAALRNSPTERPGLLEKESLLNTYKRVIAFEKSNLERYKADTDAPLKRVMEMDRQLMHLEEKMKQFNQGLKILYPTVILRCPQCLSLLFQESASSSDGQQESIIVKGEINRSQMCTVCGHTVNQGECLRTYLHGIIPSVMTVWQENLWLEEYVSKLLRSMQWRTWSHVLVLGSSGIRHEVDVLAIKKSYILICECKVGSISREDVFSFWTKAYDIRSHVSMLALVGQLPEPETSEFVAKNPSIVMVDKLGDKRKDQIRRELQKSVLARI
jgi:hypothetical protein